MSEIDFRKKINWHGRFRSPEGQKNEHEILRIFESDRGRIVNSPAIRRCSRKHKFSLWSVMPLFAHV